MSTYSQFSRFSRACNIETGYNVEIEPIVDIEAWVDGRKSCGTGFILSGYPNIIVTARHVIRGDNGAWANSLGILALGRDGTKYDVEAEIISAHSTQSIEHGDADVAAIRIKTQHDSPLTIGSSGIGKCSIRGFQKSEEQNCSVVACDGPWLKLSSTSPTGMSGSPVCRGNTVIGIFLRDSSESSSKGKAYAIDHAAVMDCMRGAS